MAGRTRLSARPAVRFAAVVAFVLLFHHFAVSWFAQALDTVPLIQPMATPMFTRVLEQAAPAAVRPPDAVATVRRKPRRAAVDPAVVQKPAPPASAPVPEPHPAPPPETIASAPAPVAEPATPPAGAASATAAASAPAGPNLDTWPVDTRLNYRLTGFWRGEVHGNARVQWQRQQERYQARIEIAIDPFVSLTLTSQGEVAEAGLSPRAYEETRPSRIRAVRLTEDALVLNDGRRLPRPAGVQDTASQFVELSHRFSTGREKLEVGRTVQVWLARPGGVDLWTYDIVQRESLQTRTLGTVEAFHLKPRPLVNPRGNIHAEMWFAPSLQYLPVRIRINMDDAHVDLLVEKIEQR